jgi:hypothetical protein
MTRNIWIGIVVIIVLVAGGWWYLNQSSVPAESQLPTLQEDTNAGTRAATNPAPVQQTPKTTTHSNPTPAKSAYISELQSVSLPVPTLNTVAWVQYNDVQSGISFKYNPSWRVEKTTGPAADNILVIVDNSTVINIGLYHEKKTLDDMVRSALNEGCTGCTFKTPIVNTLPSGKYVVEVYAYDTNNKVDMRPGTFYFGNPNGQFSLRGEGGSAPAATIAILNLLSF